jgi:GrpB-like predicted nucleotidyltransferase (UPF0157 family)
MDEISALISAIEEGDTGRVEELLLSNPELSHARHANGVCGLLWALYYGQAAIAERLAQGRNDLDIFESAALGRVERLADLLIEDRQQANAWSPDGFQPLGLACFFGQPAAARLLIESGAEIDIPSKNGAKVMPFHSAVASGQLEITRLFLRRGAPVNARQNGDFTALHSAAQNGQLEMLDLLLAYGADLDVHTRDGKAPLDFANQGGHTSVAERMQAAVVTRRVILRPYDSTWPALFRVESVNLLPIFEPLLGAIYHIGSTSVPGLLAKPTIDILIEVIDLARVDELNPAMTDQGYQARGENGIIGRRYFVQAENGIHRVHVHVFQTGNPEISRHLAFRDFLRKYTEIAEAYADLKEELAVRYVLDPDAYTDAKESFIWEIDHLAAAERKNL